MIEHMTDLQKYDRIAIILEMEALIIKHRHPADTRVDEYIQECHELSAWARLMSLGREERETQP